MKWLIPIDTDSTASTIQQIKDIIPSAASADWNIHTSSTAALSKKQATPPRSKNLLLCSEPI